MHLQPSDVIISFIRTNTMNVPDTQNLSACQVLIAILSFFFPVSLFVLPCHVSSQYPHFVIAGHPFSSSHSFVRDFPPILPARPTVSTHLDAAPPLQSVTVYKPVSHNQSSPDVEWNSAHVHFAPVVCCCLDLE